MGITKLISLFYLLYTGYTILVCGTTNLSLLYVFPALLLMWLFFFFFIIGFNSTKNVIIPLENSIKQKDRFFGVILCECGAFKLFLFGALSVIISVVCAHYYTNQWPLEVLTNIIVSKSNYINYQVYFGEADIKTMSLSKVPYILMLGLNKIIFVYSYILIFGKAYEIKIKHILFFIILAIAHLYFGVARGTNFESYQLFLILVYSYVLRMQNINKKINLFVIISLGAFLVIVFITVLGTRGANPDRYITDHIVYDHEALFSTIFPYFSLYYMFLYTYLGFGIYYLATMINEIWFTSISGFVGAFFPLFNDALGISPIKKTNELVVIGVKWVPDAASIISITGVIGLFLLCYLIGYILNKVSYSQMKNSSYFLLFGYFVFVFFVSIPNGHFLSFSSEQILIVYTLFRYILYCRRIKYRYND